MNLEIGEDRIAVALHYKPDGDRLPEVAAKGRGLMAEQILAMAEAHDIPVREDPDLVEILKQLDVGSPIPAVAFAAVAGILGALYRANARMIEEGGYDPRT